VICPHCMRETFVGEEYKTAPLEIIVVTVCFRCNELFRVIGCCTRDLSVAEYVYVRNSDCWPTLQTLQLRNSCLRKMETAAFN